MELQVQYIKIPSSNLLGTEIQNNFCTQHVLPMFCKKKSFWQRFTCTGIATATLLLHSVNGGQCFTTRRIEITDNGPEVFIGRKLNGKVHDLVTSAIFDCPVVSRKHAVIWYKDSVLWLYDSNSANGTFLNGNQVSTYLLKVRLSQNGFMKSSIFQKNDPKILKDFCPMYYKNSQGRNPSNFCINFWKLMIS